MDSLLLGGMGVVLVLMLMVLGMFRLHRRVAELEQQIEAIEQPVTNLWPDEGRESEQDEALPEEIPTPGELDADVAVLTEDDTEDESPAAGTDSPVIEADAVEVGDSDHSVVAELAFEPKIEDLHAPLVVENLDSELVNPFSELELQEAASEAARPHSIEDYERVSVEDRELLAEDIEEADAVDGLDPGPLEAGTPAVDFDDAEIENAIETALIEIPGELREGDSAVETAPTETIRMSAIALDELFAVAGKTSAESGREEIDPAKSAESEREEPTDS